MQNELFPSRKLGVVNCKQSQVLYKVNTLPLSKSSQ